jgi:hypothetical protein
MSTAPEYLRAQQEVWDKFCNGTLPREHWPKHFLAPATLRPGSLLHGLPDLRQSGGLFVLYHER